MLVPNSAEYRFITFASAGVKLMKIEGDSIERVWL
jgi:hypothetical protein